MRKIWLSVRRRALVLCTIAAGAVLAGCEDPGGPSTDVYALATVNQQALPAEYPDPLIPQGTFVVTAGELVLEDDGTLRGSFTVGCRSALPEGTTCTVSQPRQAFQGSYSRAEGWMQLGESRYPAQFEDRSVSVRVFIPQYRGIYPEYALRFSR